MRNVLLHSLLPFSNSYELSHWCQVLCEEPGKGKTCSYGAENELDETELDMLTNRGKEMGRLCTRQLRREGLRRLKRFRRSHSPALQGSSSDFRVSESTLRMSSAKRNELVEGHQCSPRQWSMVNLIDSYFQKKYGTTFPNDQQEGSEFSKHM